MNTLARSTAITTSDSSSPQVRTPRRGHSDGHHDIRSAGIPVVFAEELDEKLEQSHTPLVMRIEKAPANVEQDANGLEKVSL